MAGEKQVFAALTTWRAISALCIVQYHAWIFVNPAWPESWIIHGFEVWPDFFFALSGFILMHVYGNNLFARKDGLYNYFIHRIARIYPLHVFVLLVLICLETLRWTLSHWTPDIYGNFFSGSTNPKYILTNLLLIQAWGVQAMDSWNVPAWSISSEFACYLVFPLLIHYGVIARKTTAVALVLLVTAGLIWIQLTRNTFNVTYDLGAPRAFFSFSLGCVLYHYRHALLNRLAFIPPLLLQSLVIAAILSAFAINVIPLLFIPLWILLIASFTYEQTLLSRILAWRPFEYLGDISYSIYMVHIVVLWPLLQARSAAPELLKDFIAWPPVLILLTILAVTIALSSLTYRYIENPGRTFIRKRFDRKNTG